MAEHPDLKVKYSVPAGCPVGFQTARALLLI
jgi:hypothetical protein